jgi:hypothetical protein
VRFNVNLGRTGTIEQAYEWIQQNVPKGAGIAIESRQLLLAPESYRTINVPRLTGDFRAPGGHADYVEQGFDYLVATSAGYGPSFAEPHRFPEDYAAYMRLFEQSRELVRFSPSDEHPGPEVRIFAVR